MLCGVMPIATLSGKPVMCCVIFSGVRENHLCKTSLDLTKPFIGTVEDRNFVEKNSGDCKIFPGGPTTKFNGKTIPCFCRWSEKAQLLLRFSEIYWPHWILYRCLIARKGRRHVSYLMATHHALDYLFLSILLTHCTLGAL